ncbi:helix-turn-helix transcriptional regulator [Actinopolymorpha sp. B11F2]|uniref:helix-turn-helix domain-containing protein n=1 Tax=Actinopolymorpha sp. B11F2 TaxID=3160862 RepID=UPI0032E44108
MATTVRHSPDRDHEPPPVRQVSYCWRLRELMSAHGMVAATELQPPLAARGIRISAVAAWRLVTHPPTRLSLPVLAALCDIFDCTPADLIQTSAVDSRRTRT